MASEDHVQQPVESEADESDDLNLPNRGYYTEPRVRRQPIIFVKSTGQESESASLSDSSRKSIAEQYRSIVLAKTGQATTISATSESTEPQPSDTSPHSEPHATQAPPQSQSIVDQLATQYVKPPSALDRKRKGLQYLEAQGWDPDDRAGLGAQRNGIAFPIKAVERAGKGGIGTAVRSPSARSESPTNGVQKLGIRDMRRVAAEEKRRHERLQRLFYQDDRIERYLGEDG